MSATLAFVLAASAVVAPGRDHTSLATAIATRVDAERPLFANDEDRRKTSAWLVAIAYRESSLRLDAVGDHGRSFCAFQLHETSGGKRSMLTDADACVGAAFPMLRTSMRVCPAFPLAWYAHGGNAAVACASARAQRLSRDRSALAAKLVRDVAATARTSSLFLCPRTERTLPASAPRDRAPAALRLLALARRSEDAS